MFLEFLFCLIVILIIYSIKSPNVVIYYTKHIYNLLYMNYMMFSLFFTFIGREKKLEDVNYFYGRYAKFSTSLGINIELRGLEAVTKNKSAIIVMNRQSILDIMGGASYFPIIGPVKVFAHAKVRFLGIYRLVADHCQTIFLTKKTLEETKQMMKEEMEKVKKSGCKVFIAPEGTRRNTGKIHVFKKGAFHLALQTQTTIVPVVTSSYKLFLDAEEKIFNRGEVIIEALPEVSVETYTNAEELLEVVRNSMISAFNRNTEEVRKRMIQKNMTVNSWSPSS